MELREGTEERALAGERHQALRAAAAADARREGDVSLWVLDEGARRRALQAVRSAEAELLAAEQAQERARVAWSDAHQDTEAARRGADRKRAEQRVDEDRRERRDADEVAARRHGREQ